MIDIFGQLETGKCTALGTSAKIRCMQNIKIEDGADITEECQVLDTNFHYVQNIHTEQIPSMTGRIHIGKFCWIGNRTTITKGTYLPDYSMICSNSLVNKDFSNVTQRCPLIGGIPAKLIGHGQHGIYDKSLEKKLYSLYRNDPDRKPEVMDVEPVDYQIDILLRSQTDT